MSRNLTIEEVARQAGVSRATVSRVVNGDARVSPATRERVQRVIAEHGYSPNAAARALARRRTQAIGLATDAPMTELFGHPYFTLLIQGIAEACERRGYGLVLTPMVSHTPEGLRNIRRGHLDGVVVSTVAVGDAFLARLDDVGLPYALVGRHPARPEIPAVTADNVAGGRMAAEHLLHLGYRRIAAISGTPGLGSTLDRLEGYTQALSAAGITPQEEWVVPGDYTERGGYRAMQRLLALRPRCEAVFCGNDLTAIGAMRALSEAGLRVPDDVAIVGYDDVPVARLVDPPLTTVRQPITEIGRLAAERLIDRLEGVEPPEEAHAGPAFDVELIIRGSCGAGLPPDARRVTREPAPGQR